MLRIPRRFSHCVFGAIQSGLTCALATTIASYALIGKGTFAVYWLQSWLIAWISMLPIALFAAPVIRKMTHALTRDD